MSVITECGTEYYASIIDRNVGTRPALPLSSISNIPTNGVSGCRANDGILEVEYGYYPQKAVSSVMQYKLEQAFQRRSLSKTGKKYTTDSKKYYEFDEEFSPKQLEEFLLDEKRYVRVEANISDVFCKLSNGEEYMDGEPVWVEVAPVKWLVDERAKLMLTDKVIFAGVQFTHTKHYHTEDFDRTDIKIFMDRYLSIELEQSRGTIEVGEQSEEIPEQALSLHTGIETGQYTQDGLEAYTGIGQMYSGYLGKDTKEVRGEDDDRSQV